MRAGPPFRVKAGNFRETRPRLNLVAYSCGVTYGLLGRFVLFANSASQRFFCCPKPTEASACRYLSAQQSQIHANFWMLGTRMGDGQSDKQGRGQVPTQLDKDMLAPPISANSSAAHRLDLIHTLRHPPVRSSHRASACTDQSCWRCPSR